MPQQFRKPSPAHSRSRRPSSQYQVRRSVYGDSVGLSERFGEHLAALRTALEKAAPRGTPA